MEAMDISLVMDVRRLLLGWWRRRSYWESERDVDQIRVDLDVFMTGL